MDSNEVEVEQNTKDQLKHLGFIRKIALKILVVLSNVYAFTKENSGVHKTMILSAENELVSNVMPVYEKLKDLPEQTLVFVDDKFDKYAPALAKNLFAKIQTLITNPADLTNQLFDTTNALLKEYPVLRTVNSAAQNIVKEAQLVGTKAALQSGYMSFKTVAIPVIAQLWYKVNTYPLFRALGKVIEPVAEYLFEWYNKVIKCMDGKGYGLFGYFPSIPIDEMKATYKLVKATMDGLSAVGDLVSRDE